MVHSESMAVASAWIFSASGANWSRRRSTDWQRRRSTCAGGNPNTPIFDEAALTAAPTSLQLVFSEKPEVLALEEWYTSAKHLEPWMATGGALAPQSDVDLSKYGNEVERSVAAVLALLGRSSMKKMKGKPERTIKNAQDTVTAVKSGS